MNAWVVSRDDLDVHVVDLFIQVAELLRSKEPLLLILVLRNLLIHLSNVERGMPGTC